MKYSEFYREPVAKIINSIECRSVEIGLRTCYESFFGLEFKPNTELDPILIKPLVELTPEEKEFKNEYVKNCLRQKTLPEFSINYNLIKEVAFNKSHKSVLEHSVFNIWLEMPRNVLHELSRHRIVSPSVKSTRYTLNKGIKLYKKYIKDNKIIDLLNWFLGDCGLVDNDFNMIDFNNFIIKMDLCYSKNIKLTPDIVKNFLPEHWYCCGFYTMNLRELLHMFNLRMPDSVFLPYRKMMYHLYMDLSDDLKAIVDVSTSELIRIRDCWDSNIDLEYSPVTGEVNKK
jgi:thymidylate synthase ThyX